MGKKSKVGKSRKDKFYRLAKETGFRARSAFKLLQLNRKYEFLQNSRVCVDLCAAPGGWLQVASQNMPVSSLIVGVDLVPIKAIKNVTTFQADITTDKCRQLLKKELQTWKADVFLNDGAPNVGKNWIQDAFTQAELTLSAFKLASEFLRKGGWFVTKVFRSKDYHALMWIFNQLFKKVYATKPQASRNESAEIFVVCQGFIAPDKLDPKFTDPKYVFQEVTPDPKSLTFINPNKVKRKAEGYEDGDYTLHHKLNVSEFIRADNYVNLLARCHKLVMDDDEIANDPLTTKEILACMSDIKVLGKRDINNILKWRKKIREKMEKSNDKTEEEEDEDKTDESDGEDLMDEKIAELQREEAQILKRKRKKMMKEKRKLRDKMALKMVVEGDTVDVTNNINMFDIKKIKKKGQLEEVNSDANAADHNLLDDSEDENEIKLNKQAYARDNDYYVDEMISDSEESESSNDEGSAESEGSVEASDDEEYDPNPLIVNLENEDAIQSRKTDMWFKKDIFSGIDLDEDENLEISKTVQDYKRKGGRILENSTSRVKRRKTETEARIETDSGHESDLLSESDLSESDLEESDGDYGEERDLRRSKEKGTIISKKDGFEVVPATGPQLGPENKVVKLNAVELAIGEELIKSSKRRRELIEGAYNRYTFNDEDLPDWFVADEAKHCKPQLPVTKEQINAYKEKMKAIDARAPKKVIEAKARKKRKAMKKLEQARKKAEKITDNIETSEKEKWSQIKQVYKKAGLLSKQKRDLTYVVAKRGTGKRVSRPAGVKGQFKVVDPRMKKDARSKKGARNNKGGKKARSKKR